ncbi:MAG: hypothetical protein BV459_03255 [Thermoplasmata archaeon M11B2D]|nr:MAG: hypothetical protein BV459_03255 [Thermoplasmata archaeon M11B2D]
MNDKHAEHVNVDEKEADELSYEGGRRSAQFVGGFRQAIKTQTYYMGDLNAQAKLLVSQLDEYNMLASYHGAPTVDVRKALVFLENRVARFYGLKNKYNGNGSLRERVESVLLKSIDEEIERTQQEMADIESDV